MKTNFSSMIFHKSFTKNPYHLSYVCKIQSPEIDPIYLTNFILMLNNLTLKLFFFSNIIQKLFFCVYKIVHRAQNELYYYLSARKKKVRVIRYIVSAIDYFNFISLVSNEIRIIFRYATPHLQRVRLLFMRPFFHFHNKKNIYKKQLRC